MANDPKANNTFRFLVTTDNHLGFQEKDPRRQRDSFVTFEECLRAATLEHDVDAIILAGDLFHDSKPSLNVLHKSIGLFRKYVMGNKPIAFSMLSDPSINFPGHPVPCANFQDPNLNVAYPIFTIHGNHDDPLGDNMPSPVDMLASCGLVNHFGHCPSVESVTVRPILLQKGSTFIALYGLGSMHDQRLHRCFERKQVQFLRPKEQPPVAGTRWFNILLFHQNRGIRGPNARSTEAGQPSGPSNKGGIPETMLMGFGFDVVIWGNEHEQLMMPQSVGDGAANFDIVQPGSTVMTSLSGEECNPKQYGILEVRGAQYRITPHPLKSIRPVVRRQVELWRDQPGARSVQAVEDYLRSIADEMIGEAEEQIAHIPDDVLNYHPDLKFPLMRLSVDFTSPEGGPPYPQPNANRFGQQFLDVVVNAHDMLKPIKPKVRTGAAVLSNAAHFSGDHPVVPVVPQLSTVDIRAKIAAVFNANARDACLLLSEPEVAAAVYQFADKGDRSAIEATIERLVLDSNKAIWKTLRKGKESLADVKEVRIRELALQHKVETTKKYAEQVGDDELIAQIAPAAAAAASASAASRGDDANDLLFGAAQSTHRIGAPLPKDQSAAAKHQPEDEDDARAEEELERLLPKGLLKTARGADPVDAAGIVEIDDDDGFAAATPAPPVPSSAGGKKPAGKRTAGAPTKRQRASDDDVMIVKPPAGAKGSRTEKKAAPTDGPKLLLSTKVIPAPVAAEVAAPATAAVKPTGVLNMMAHWTK